MVCGDGALLFSWWDGFARPKACTPSPCPVNLPAKPRVLAKTDCGRVHEPCAFNQHLWTQNRRSEVVQRQTRCPYRRRAGLGKMDQAGRGVCMSSGQETTRSVCCEPAKGVKSRRDAVRLGCSGVKRGQKRQGEEERPGEANNKLINRWAAVVEKQELVLQMVVSLPEKLDLRQTCGEP